MEGLPDRRRDGNKGILESDELLERTQAPHRIRKNLDLVQAFGLGVDYEDLGQLGQDEPASG